MLTDWLENWLNEKKQRMIVEDCFVSLRPVTSGMSQGVVLAPLPIMDQ